MNSKRVYYLLLVVIALLVVGILGGVYGINSVLEQRSGGLVSQKAKLASLNQEQVELTQSKKDIATYTDLYNISRTVVPQSKNQVQAVRQIVNLAAANGISLASISFPASTLGAGAATAAAPGSSTTAVPVAANAGTNSTLSQLTAVPGIAGVYDLQLVVTSSSAAGQTATYPELINFLAALEQNRLTALVSKLTVNPVTQANNSNNIRFTFVLTLDIYIKP